MTHHHAIACLCLSAALTATACDSTSPATSQLRVVNLALNTPALDVRICDAKGVCDDLHIPQHTVSPPLTLSPGLHEFHISDPAEKLTTFTYGIGQDDHYELAIYGIATAPVRPDTMTQLRRALGGSTEPLEAGMQLGHRMFSTTPPEPDAPAEIRLVHMSPVTRPLRGHLQTGAIGLDLPTVSYADAGARLDVERPDAHLVLSLAHSPISLAERDITLPQGTLTMIYTGALDAQQLRVVTSRTSSDDELGK